MKIQYSNRPEDRIAYIACKNATFPFIDFSMPADDPDFRIMPVFAKMKSNTFYTSRDFMNKAKLFSREESSFLMQLSNNFPAATLIVVD